RLAGAAGPLEERARAVAQLVLVRTDERRRHQREPERVASGPLALGVELLPERADVVHRGEGRVVLVGPAHGGPHGAALPAAADDQRRARLLHRLRQRAGRLQPVVLARERELVLGPLAHDDLYLLAEQRDAPRGLAELEAVRVVLELHPADAHPELGAAARD